MALTHTQHRDLHLGNILVHCVDRTAQSPSSSAKRLEEVYAPSRVGVRATIIDYTLSRMDVGSATLAYDFRDASLFEGQGDVQYQVYRDMRTLVAGEWRGYAPITNVLVSDARRAS